MTTNKNPENIKKMFNELASDYDFMNQIISFGLHKLLKRVCLRLPDLPENAIIADLCCGTGDIARILAKNKKVKKIFALYFSENMLKIAKNKTNSDKIDFVQGDCTNLPFATSSLDGCTMAFGLRNIQNYEKSVSEIQRVLKNGGFFLHLDIFKGAEPENTIFDLAACNFAKIFSKSPESYKYLISSKNNFLPPQKLAESVENQGFKCKKIKNYAFGMISMQLFVKDCSPMG